MLLFICIKGTYLRTGQLQMCCNYGHKGVDAATWTLKSLEVRSGPAPCAEAGDRGGLPAAQAIPVCWDFSLCCLV